MSSSGTPSRQQTADEENGSQPFMLMENVIDKLKLLNYEDGFIKTLKMRPLNRHYFALSTNPGEQFFMFVALCAWLIQKCGLPFDQPQEDDDPNSTIASILDALRSLGISVDFSPNKLKKGSGLYALQCLSALLDKAIAAQNVSIKKPNPPSEENDVLESTDDGDDPELALDRVEEEMSLEESDADEDNELDVDDLYLASVDSTDWRSHLDMMKRHQSELWDVSSSVSSLLSKFSSDIDETMRKVSKREKLINNQFDQILTHYRALQEELAALNEKYRDVNVGVVERQKTLTQISDTLESIKVEMEERGATMSDGSPLVHIKKAIKDVKKEISDMDISIAVAEHTIVETKLREKSLESHLIRTSGI